MAIYPLVRPETRATGVATTDATITTIAQVVIRKNEAYAIKAFVVCSRSGGASGTAGDAAGYELMGVFRDNGGTLEQIGSTVKVASETEAAWDADFAVSGNNVLVRVTGESSVNIDWRCDLSIHRIK